MKKFMLALCLSFVSLGTFAQEYYDDSAAAGDWAVGLNIPFTFGDDTHLGFGPKLQYYATQALRLEASFDYYLEANERIDWDLNFNLHYLIPAKYGISIYPVVGMTFLHRHWTFDGAPGDSGSLGLNIGIGAQYDVTSNIFVNYECKYQYVNNHDRANMCVGIGFRF
ncbi:MAG: porin family protein [Bacteroidaceae bacterium]|nr:porin family protein [Bacteroidaceae bacterium]